MNRGCVTEKRPDGRFYIAPFTMLNQPNSNSPAPHQRPAYLVYARAVDLRLCLILSNAGLSVRPVSGVDSFLAAHAHQCDGIVLIDVSKQDNGAAIVEQLISRLHGQVVIPICANGSVEFCRRCFKAGALDVLDKSFNDQAIADALQASLATLGAPAARHWSRSPRRERFALLTRREREVFHYVAEGLNNHEIGEILCISPRTVEYYRGHLKVKLAARNLAQMVRRYGAFLDESFEIPCVNGIADS